MSDSPSTSEAETADDTHPDGAFWTEYSWQTLAKDYLWGQNREVDLYVGTAMFAGAILLGVGAFVVGLYSGTQTIGSGAYWQFRELAFVAILLAIPAFVASDTAIASIAGRIRVLFVVGFCLCLLAVGLFSQSYPYQWVESGQFTRPALTLLIYAIGLMGLTTVRGAAIVTQKPLISFPRTEISSQRAPSDLAESNAESDTMKQIESDSGTSEDAESPSSDSKSQDISSDNKSLIDRGERSENERELDLSLDRAREQLDSGNPDQAVITTYVKIEEHLLNQLDVSSDPTPTPRELLELCRQEGLDSEIYTSLRDLIETFEQVVYGAEPIERDVSEAVLANGETILHNDLRLEQEYS